MAKDKFYRPEQGAPSMRDYWRNEAHTSRIVVPLTVLAAIAGWGLFIRAVAWALGL